MVIQHYKLRIDSHTCVDSITQGIKTYSYVFEGLPTFENPEKSNPHTHFYLATRLKNDTLRKRIKKLPDYKPGNSFYSLCLLKSGDPEFPYLKYHAYMAKEGKPVYVGFTPQRLEILKEKIAEYNKTVKEQMKEKTKGRRTILQQMEDDFKYGESDHPIDRNTVVQDVVQWYKTNDKLPREFLMVSQVQYLLLKYDPEYQVTLETNILRAIDKTH